MELHFIEEKERQYVLELVSLFGWQKEGTEAKINLKGNKSVLLARLGENFIIFVTA